MHIRGWCPGLHTPMMARDGFLVRLSPPEPDITPAQLRALRCAAKRSGQNAVYVTMQGNIQVRGLTRSTIAAFRDEMIAEGLSEPTAQRERARRAVVASALRGLDPWCASETQEVLENLVAALEHNDFWSRAYSKFRFIVDGGGLFSVDPSLGHIRARSVEGAWHITFGNISEVRLTTAEVTPCLLHLANQHTNRHGARKPVARAIEPHAARFCEVGPILSALYVYGASYGVISCDTIGALARCSRGIRVLPHRFVLAESGLSAPSLEAVADAPSLRVFGCGGQQACVYATTDTVQDAQYLTTQLSPGLVLHVSGCDKGCAYPRAADVTIVGRDGAYDLVRNGSARATPCATGLSLSDVQHRLNIK